MSALLEAALHYAELGYPVFPCANGLKPTPLTRSGFKEASTDPAQIAAWWSQYPQASIGLATAGLLVIDVDGSGNPWLTTERALELAHTPTALTPRGGRHFVFRKPKGATWGCSVGKVAPQVDVRTDGGYIVVAPSSRPDGRYHWIEGLALDVPAERLPEPPRWLAELLEGLAKPTKLVPSVGTDVSGAVLVEHPIPSGQRNSTLARLAGTMRRVGMSRQEIAASLQRANQDRCVPPLEAQEVDRIAESISRYEPDMVSVAITENHWGQLRNHDEQFHTSSVTWFSEIEPVEVRWLWPERIPASRMSLLVGLPGKGKSLVTIDAAARVSTGRPWPDGTPCPQGSAILITAEDNPNDTIRPRLDAAGANVERVGLLSMIRRHDPNGRPYETPFTLADVEALEFELSRLPDCKLIVIDPIGSFLGGQTDAHRDNEVRAVLAPVAALAEKYGPAVVVVAHRRKSAGALADDMALGSRAFTGLARAVWHVTPDPADKHRRLFLPGKNNLAPEGQGLAFTIGGEQPALEWEEQPVAMNADECLAAESKPSKSKPGPKDFVKQEAMAWLRKVLADSPRLVNELIEEADQAAGITRSSLRRARKELGIEAYREQIPGPWYWRMPQDAEVVTNSEHLGNLEHLAELLAPDGLIESG